MSIMRKMMTVSLIAGGLLLGTAADVSAEIRQYTGVGEYVMSDFETPDVAKQRAKVRAEQNAQEQAGVFVNSFTKVNNYQVTEQEIRVITSGVLSVQDTNYDVQPSAEGWVFRATVTANVDTDQIDKWFNMNDSDKAALIARNQELQNALAEQERKIAELQRQLNGQQGSSADTTQLRAELASADNNFLANQKIEAGDRFYFQGDYNSAISSYTQAIELNPNNAMAYINRGASYANLKEYNRAEADYSKLIALEPNNVQAYIGRGASYICLQQYNKAAADLTKAIELDPSNSMAYYNRGICYQAMGNTSRAQADYAKARALGYNN